LISVRIVEQAEITQLDEFLIPIHAIKYNKGSTRPLLEFAVNVIVFEVFNPRNFIGNEVRTPLHNICNSVIDFDISNVFTVNINVQVLTEVDHSFLLEVVFWDA
jgi:hypothetical protein